MNASTVYELAKILVRHIETAGEANRTLTYGQLSRTIGGIPPIVLNNPLGRLCEISRDAGFPAISAIVVNQRTGIPGSGFYEYVGELYTGRKVPESEWEQFWGEQVDMVYSRTDWRDYLRSFAQLA